MSIRVFIVDDHALVRTGFRLILGSEPDIEVVGEADSAEQALPQIRKLKPDVVLCDLHLPGLSGLEVTERVVRGEYGSRVIVVSVLEDGPMPRRLLEAGAFGYVGKACDAVELLEAVRDVARGRKYLSSAIAQGLALAGLQGEMASPFDALTPRAMLDTLLRGQMAAVASVEHAVPSLERAAGAMAQAIRAGGRLVYVGAGSSGLMAMADALELPGTYGLDASQVVVLMAGGLPGAYGRAELPGGPEDDAGAAEDEIAAHRIGAGDCVLAVTASGSTPYVLSAAAAARKAGAVVVGFANNGKVPLFDLADVAVLLETPPEIVAGSTRMGAGSAQKIAFNMASTLMATMLGHVHEGHMVNLKADNQKLRARAQRMVSEIAGIDLEQAEARLAEASGSVKIAVLLAAGAGGLTEAEALLAAGGQHLSAALRFMQTGKVSI